MWEEGGEKGGTEEEKESEKEGNEGEKKGKTGEKEGEKRRKVRKRKERNEGREWIGLLNNDIKLWENFCFVSFFSGNIFWL